MVRYSALYEKYVAITPRLDDPTRFVISKWDTPEMAQAYEDSQKNLKTENTNSYWWNKN